MALMVISLLVLTIFSVASGGTANPGLDVCEAGTGSYSPDVLLAFLPPPPGQQDRQCVCHLRSPHPLSFALIKSLAKHPTGDGLDSGGLNISLGNETFNFTSSEAQALKPGRCDENANIPCFTLTFTETGTMWRLFLFQLQVPNTSNKSAGNLTIQCQGNTTKEVTTINTGATTSFPAPTSHSQTSLADLVQTSNVIVFMTALTLLLLLVLLLLLLLHHRWSRESRRQEDYDKEKVALESPAANNDSYSGGRKSEGGRRGERRQRPPPASVISNFSSDVFLEEEGPQVSGSPPHAPPGGRHASGGRASSTSPTTQRHPKTSAGSTGDGRGLSADPRDRARVPSPAPIHRPTAPAQSPSPTTAKPEEEQEDEWYGNLEVEKTIENRSASQENLYADPDEAISTVASATKVAAKASVKVIALKGARVEQERKGGAVQGTELSKIAEAPVQTAAPSSPGQTDPTQQPRSQPRTPQSPGDTPGSGPRFDLQKQRSRDDVKIPPADMLQSQPPTSGPVPGIQTEEEGQGKMPTPNRSRDASPSVPAKTRGRHKSLDFLDSHVGLSLLFPDSGRASKASIVSQGESVEMAQVDSKEDEEEDIYQNYSVARQSSTQEAKEEQAASSPKPVVLFVNELYESSTPALKPGSPKPSQSPVLIDNELYESSTPALKPGSPKPSQSSVVLIDNKLYESSTPALKPGSPKPSQSPVVLIDNELYESSTPAPKSASSTTRHPLAMTNELLSRGAAPAKPPATGPALLAANHSGKSTSETPHSPVRSDGCVLEDNILYESSANLLAHK